MFEIAVNTLQGPYDSYQLLITSTNTFQLTLISTDIPASVLTLGITLNKLKFWDEFQSLHSKLTQTSEAFENFKLQKEFEALAQSQESKKNTELLESKIEKLNVKEKRLQNLNKSIMQEKNCVEEMLSHEREYIKTLEMKIKENLNVYSESLKKAEERDSVFVNRLSEIMKENSNLRQNAQKLKFCVEEGKNNGKSFEKKECGVCELNEKLVDSSDFYNLIRFSQENLEILYKNMCKVIKEYSVQAGFSVNKGLEIENEQLKIKLTDLNEKCEEIQKELRIMTEEKAKFILESSEKDLKLDEKTRETEYLYQKIKQDTMENTILSDSLEIQPNSLDSSKDLIENPLKLQEKSQISDQEHKIKDLEVKNGKLATELFQLKSKTVQELKLERLKVDNLDLLIEKFCCENGFENLFIKVFSGLYLFRSKQVNISYEKNEILCRFGGFTTNITNFLKNENQKGILISSNTNDKPIQSPRLKNKSILRENENPDDRKILKEKLFSPVRKSIKRIY